MNKSALLASVFALAAPAIASATWTEIGTNNFDGGASTLAMDAQADASNSGAGTVVWTPNYDYTTAPTPALPALTGGDGAGLLAAANNNTATGTGAEQNAYQTFGAVTDTDRAVEAVLAPYLGSDNSNGSTTFGGVGVRVGAATATAFESGYWAEMRVDTSGSFGSYVNFYKNKAAGTPELLGRYYFAEGTGGIAAGTLTSPNESRVIRSPEAAATNTWTSLRIEAVDVTGGTQVKLFVDNLASPVVDWLDTDPVAAGQGVIFSVDPFGSYTFAAGSSAIIFDYVTYEEWTTSAVNDWTIYR